MTNQLTVLITSVPDKECLIAELWDGHLMAEVSQEQGNFNVQIFPRPDGQPWIVNVDYFMNQLQAAVVDLSNS